MENHSTCIHCGNLCDDKVHFIIKCPRAQHFWDRLVNWWNANFILKIDKNRDDFIENTLFEFMSRDCYHKCLNFVWMYAKYYIYCNKQFNKNELDLWKFYIYLVNKLKCEISAINRESHICLDMENKTNKKESILTENLNVLLPIIHV